MARRVGTSAVGLLGLLQAAHGQVQCDYLGSDIEATSAEVGWDR